MNKFAFYLTDTNSIILINPINYIDDSDVIGDKVAVRRYSKYEYICSFKAIDKLVKSKNKYFMYLGEL